MSDTAARFVTEIVDRLSAVRVDTAELRDEHGTVLPPGEWPTGPTAVAEDWRTMRTIVAWWRERTMIPAGTVDPTAAAATRAVAVVALALGIQLPDQLRDAGLEACDPTLVPASAQDELARLRDVLQDRRTHRWHASQPV